jgi:hypothetical protein
MNETITKIYAPMIKEEGIYGFEPSFIKGNSKLLNLYSKVLNTYIGNYSIHKTATAIPDFQQPFKICEFFVTVAMISLSNKSTIWSPN